MPPIHVENLLANVDEVLQLVAIHETISGTSRGRRYDVEALNKSGVVLLVACWEAYIEDLATTAFNMISTLAKDHSAFPARVLTLASKDLRSSNDERRVWELAGTGWQEVLKVHRGRILKKFVGALNTPKPEQVDALFEELIGLSSISESWRWHRTTSQSARERLVRLVELRGEIAHRVSASRGVIKRDVTQATDFVQRLAVASSNRVRQHVHACVGKYPWQAVVFKQD